MPFPFKLGKTPARAWGSRFYLTRYTTPAALPPVPALFGHQDLISAYGMLANDRYGDCVWAGAAHETMLLNKEANNTVAFTETDVLSDYSAATGFNAADPATDQGTDVQVAAEYRRSTGVVDANGVRHKIAAYLSLEPANLAHLYQAAYLFGIVGIGLQLPQSALDQFQAGQPWTVVQGAPNIGGHYVPFVGRTAAGLAVVTWGAVQVMSETFLAAFCDEAATYVSQENLINQKSPEGFDYDSLIADLDQLS